MKQNQVTKLVGLLYNSGFTADKSCGIVASILRQYKNNDTLTIEERNVLTEYLLEKKIKEVEANLEKRKSFRASLKTIKWGKK